MTSPLPSCCICNENKRFLARVNAGKKLYCIQCEAKISKEYGTDYWKPCSFQEFMEAFSSSLQKGKRKPANMFNNIRETLRQIDEERQLQKEKG